MSSAAIIVPSGMVADRLRYTDDVQTVTSCECIYEASISKIKM